MSSNDCTRCTFRGGHFRRIYRCAKWCPQCGRVINISKTIRALIWVGRLFGMSPLVWGKKYTYQGYYEWEARYDAAVFEAVETARAIGSGI